MKILLILLFFSVNISAQTMSGLLKGMKVDKTQVRMMIDQMQRSGKISKKEAGAAKKELSGMSQTKMDAMNVKAVKMIEGSKGSTKNSMPKLDDTMKALEKAEKILDSN